MINPGQFERVTFAVGLASVRPELRARIMADILSIACATGRHRTQNKATRAMMIEAAIAIASMGHEKPRKPVPAGDRLRAAVARVRGE